MTGLIPLVVDFESFYDTKAKYSLKHMPAAQYVRDPRFDCLGAAVRLPGQAPKWLDPEPLRAFLDNVPWDRVLFVAHNASFDGLVLTERYGHRPAAYACTMFMVRYLISQGHDDFDPRMRSSLEDCAPVVGMEKGDLDRSLEAGALDTYALDDAEICGRLFDRYWTTLPEDERDYIDTHVRMAAEPVFELNRERLQELADKDKSIEGLFPLVRKDEKFAAALTALGVEPEYKRTAKGNLKLAVAKTDDFMKRLLAHDDPRVSTLAELRRKAGSSIERTRSQRFLDIGSPLPAPLIYYGAHTGRAAGSDKINLQNLPIKDGIRQCVEAPDGHVFVIVDASQIEVRVNAWLAGQEDLLDDFRLGRDPYLSFGAFLYQRDYEEMVAQHAEGDAETNQHRKVAKAAVLALGFMQGANGFLQYCKTFGVSMTADLAQRTVSAYRERYPHIRRHAYRTLDEVRATGAQVLPTGRRLTYPDLRVNMDGDVEYRRATVFAKGPNEGWSKLWHGMTVENKVQAVARDVVFAQQMILKRQGYHIALMVHDEVCMVVPRREADQALSDALGAFATPSKWAPDLPVSGEGRITSVYVK